MARSTERMDPAVEATIRTEVARLSEQFKKRADLTRETASLLFLRYGIYPSAAVVHSYTRYGSLTDISTDLKAFWQNLRDRVGVQIPGAELPQELLQKVGDALNDIWSLALRQANETFEQQRAEAEAAVAQSQRMLEVSHTEAARVRLEATGRIEQANKERDRAEERRSDAEQQLAVEREAREQAVQKIAEAETRAMQERMAREASEKRFAAELEAMRLTLLKESERLVGEVNFAKRQIDQAREEGRHLKLRNEHLASEIETNEKMSRAKIEALSQELSATKNNLSESKAKLSVMDPQIERLNQLIISTTTRAEAAEHLLLKAHQNLHNAQDVLSSRSPAKPSFRSKAARIVRPRPISRRLP